MMSAEYLQRELIIDHYKHPRRKGLLAAPDGRCQQRNPFCGDEVTIDLQIVDGLVVDAAFDGRGCTISQATTSLLLEEIVGWPVEKVAALDQQAVLALLGIEIGSVRIKCALLPLAALQGALIQSVGRLQTDSRGSSVEAAAEKLDGPDDVPADGL